MSEHENTTVSAKAFWCNKEPNFGDVLTQFLFKRLYDIDLEWTPVEETPLIAIGSILDLLPQGYNGHVLGTGIMNRGNYIDLGQAQVHLLRGRLTQSQVLNCSKRPLGDPGLLAGLLASSRRKRHKRGIIPHYQDRNNLEIQEWQREALIIDVTWPVQDVIDAAASCEEIVSSSLHGLILADSLGIPNKWVSLSTLKGRRFKFEDYYSVYNKYPEPAGTIYKAFNALNVMDAASVQNEVKGAMDSFVERFM